MKNFISMILVSGLWACSTVKHSNNINPSTLTDRSKLKISPMVGWPYFFSKGPVDVSHIGGTLPSR